MLLCTVIIGLVGAFWTSVSKRFSSIDLSQRQLMHELHRLVERQQDQHRVALRDVHGRIDSLRSELLASVRDIARGSDVPRRLGGGQRGPPAE